LFFEKQSKIYFFSRKNECTLYISESSQPMAAAAHAARKYKNGRSIKVNSNFKVKRNFTNLTESILGISSIAEDLVKNPVKTATAQVQSLAEKLKEEFSTLPQEMDVKNEIERSANLFLQDKVYKMSDPITDEIRHASPWMPATATLGRDRIYLTAPIADDETKEEAVIEDVPLLLIDWLECGCLTKISSRWKVIAEPGPDKANRLQNLVRLNQEGLLKDEEKDSGKAESKWKVVSGLLASVKAFQNIMKINGIAVQPPPNYLPCHSNELSEAQPGRFLRVTVQCSGKPAFEI
jgi:hypothetical protein